MRGLWRAISCFLIILQATTHGADLSNPPNKSVQVNNCNTDLRAIGMHLHTQKSVVTRTGDTRGFSLVELLVVVATVGVLAAITLPAVTRAKQAAHRTVCISNQKQLSNASALYSTDQSDNLVPNGIDTGNQDSDGKRVFRKLWVKGSLVRVQENENAELLVNPKYALFAPYISSPATYFCPADLKKTDSLEGSPNPLPLSRVRSYSLNSFLGWASDIDSRLERELSTCHVYMKASDFQQKSPAEIFSFLDVNADSICGPNFGVKIFEDKVYNFPGVRHRSAANISFADGHVESHHWKDPRTASPTFRDFNTFHLHWTSSPSNADLPWLRNHATDEVSEIRK